MALEVPLHSLLAPYIFLSLKRALFSLHDPERFLFHLLPKAEFD